MCVCTDFSNDLLLQYILNLSHLDIAHCLHVVPQKNISVFQTLENRFLEEIVFLSSTFLSFNLNIIKPSQKSLLYAYIKFVLNVKGLTV